MKRRNIPFTSLPFCSRDALIELSVLSGIAVVVSAQLDTAVATRMATDIQPAHFIHIFNVVKFPGHFAFTTIVAILLWLFHPRHLSASIYLCSCGVMSGLLCVIIKWILGRTRPMKGVPPFSLQPFRGGWFGWLHESNLSFPSGHTCLAFATATALSILLPRFTIAFVVGAFAVGAERVIQSSHYFSDVVAAAALGTICALVLANRMLVNAGVPSRTEPLGHKAKYGRLDR